MPSLNKVFLMGNLTRDPEIRYTPNGTAIANFGLAINRKYKSGEDWKSDVSYFDVEVWGKQAENVNEYLLKGSGAFVEGYLKQDRWEDQGQNRSRIKVVAMNVQFMSKKSEGTKQGPSEDQGPPPQDEYDPEKNLPF